MVLNQVCAGVLRQPHSQGWVFYQSGDSRDPGVGVGIRDETIHFVLGDGEVCRNARHDDRKTQCGILQKFQIALGFIELVIGQWNDADVPLDALKKPSNKVRIVMSPGKPHALPK